MKIIVLSAILLGCVFTCDAQKSITFDVEDLKKPEQVLPVKTYNSILENLIRLDNASLTSPSKTVVAKSKNADNLVSFGYHPFFQGMYTAYADHRPFTLSPDIMWLLICQGFANHVNNNAESLRPLFVGFTGKTTLTVVTDAISLNDPNAPWEEIFPEFSKQISANTGQQLTDALTADFSTTTPITKMASQITMMDALKSYFDFVVIYIGCGIPKVTLEGTPQDWEKVLAKTEALRKYRLDWWVDKMEPVLKEFIATSNGKVDKSFWQAMFKYHTKKTCGAPTMVDGWIVHFFPYNKLGKRNNLDSLSLKETLPDEIVKVDLDYEAIEGNGSIASTPLELWAGFVGLKQNDNDFMLKPEIGWMIKKKDDVPNVTLIGQLKKEAASTNPYGGIVIRAKTIPKEVLAIGPIHTLEVYFTGDIQVPDEMANIKIDELRVHGNITAAGEKRLRKMMPNTHLFINMASNRMSGDLVTPTVRHLMFPNQKPDSVLMLPIHNQIYY